jgi:hypothetical protein
MARDFRQKCLEIRCLVVNSLCSAVLSRALQFWRQFGEGWISSSPSQRLNHVPHKSDRMAVQPRFQPLIPGGLEPN